MQRDIIDKIIEAREFFGIKEFPGNFFSLIEKENNYIEKYNLLVFKEDIGKLSGFIGYGENDLTTICINYKRPIGHQNFTFAHEIGHWFLHRGQAISDTDANLFSKNSEENDANFFASELLYPTKLFHEDYNKIYEANILRVERRKDLAIVIDELCHKYCLSFDNVLRKILFKSNMINEYTSIKKEIVKALGCTISKYFDKDFYVPNDELPQYQQYQLPYNLLKDYIKQLEKEKKIGTATAESILYRNGLLH